MGAVEEIECPHFGRMIYISECVICAGKSSDPEPISVKYIFKARYEGQMSNANCSHLVQVGESIAALSNGNYTCLDCAEEFE